MYGRLYLSIRETRMVELGWQLRYIVGCGEWIQTAQLVQA